MKKDTPSRTAENNAVLRAHESLLPATKRICFDPYAGFFLPDGIISAKDREHEIRRSVVFWESILPGVGNAIIVRSRFMDDCMEEALRGATTQVVILGAGYDTRALRFNELKNKVSVFELDHPATQKLKLDRIKKYVSLDLSHVCFISVDFAHEAFEEKLPAHGYDKNETTLFIWEGVTYYLSPSAIDRTLSFIAANKGQNTRLVLDYFPESVADGTSCLPEARALRDGLGNIQENILFGIEPEQLIRFMEKRGFTVLRNLTAPDFSAAFLSREIENRDVSKMFVFAEVEVNP